MAIEPKEGEEGFVAPKVGEVITPQADNQPKVGLDVFLDMKKDNKDLRNEVKELKDLLTESTTKKQIAESVKKIAEEYGLDDKAIDALSVGLLGEAEKIADSKAKPLQDKIKAGEEKETERERMEAQKRAERDLKEQYEKALERNPEYKDIVDADKIIALAKLPESAQKSFDQLITETYGKAITGKKTIDDTKPAGGKEPAPFTASDYAKAQKDPAYFAEIMANPELKKAYNDEMLKRAL